ncbi:MAG: TIGR02099 family protein [Gammaproteobacteria bacterium]|nr:TIGR02099 family protein [Gammaproteobacteria bacterium]
MRRWQHLTWKWTVGVITAVVLLFATLVGLFRLFVPLIPGYREQVQAVASKALGRPVNIAAIGAQWGLYGPEVTLEQVAILSHDGRHVIVTASEIRLGYTLGAMLHARFSRPNRIILVAPKLGLVREVDGSYALLGLESGGASTDWHREAGELFSQSADMIVLDGEISLLDKRGQGAALEFTKIRLDVDNTTGSHSVSARMLLPSALGKTLSFEGEILGQGIHPETWRWQATIHSNGLNVPQLLAFWPAMNERFSRGQLDLSAEISGTGATVNHLQTDFNAQQLVMAGKYAVQGMFDTLSGALSWNLSTSGWTLAVTHLQLQHNQSSWPVSEFTLQYQPGSDGDQSWSGDASFLRLQDIVALDAWLPAGFSDLSQRLLRISPSGDIQNLSFESRWHGKLPDIWSLKAAFSGLGMRADGRLPGFSGLSGQISADQNSGTLQLLSRNASATFTSLFRGPLQATALHATFTFQHDAQGWHISTGDFSASNQDLQASAKGGLLLPADGSSPYIDLQAKAQNVNARSKSSYLPVGIMPKPVVAWLDRSIVGGQAPTASLVLRGKLQDFPFDKGNGLFDIRFHLVNGILDYEKGWPRAENLDANVEFKNQGMSVEVQRGTYLGDDISGATAGFTDLRQGVLIIKGTARGDAASALNFLRSDALRQHFGHSLDSLIAKGRSDVSVNLVLPVVHMADYSMDCLARLQNVSVGLPELPKLQLSRVNGDVRITRQGVSTEHLDGMILGERVTINLQPDLKQDSTTLKVEGGENAALLASIFPAPFQKALSGNTAWRLSGELPNNPSERNKNLTLTLTSDLTGLGINLPEPLGKQSEISIPLIANMIYSPKRGMRFQFRYGDILDAISHFQDTKNGWKFDRGELAFGPESASLPAQRGLMVTGSLPELSLDAWRTYTARNGTPSGALIPGWLQGLDLKVGHFTGYGQSIEQLHVLLARDTSAWELSLDSDPENGKITIPYVLDNDHPISAEMQRVTWMHKPASKENRIDTSGIQPNDVPPLQVSVKQLRVNDLVLDNVKAELKHQADGVILKSFSISNPAFNLASNGSWTKSANGSQASTLNVQMKSTDIEKTLKSFGYAPAITAEQGELQTSLNWPGSPFTEIPPILNGKLHIQLKNGQLLEVQPGAGRLFGLLSINALPRRLLLNFSDVFGKGFAFDSIGGDFIIEHGDAYTSNMLVSGPAAKIHMLGRIGLAKHDFDEALVVDTSVGASLPIIGAIAASSVGVGAVLYVLTEIFKKPLTAAGEVRYRLTGTWDNPVLTKVSDDKKPPPPPPSKP